MTLRQFRCHCHVDLILSQLLSHVLLKVTSNLQYINLEFPYFFVWNILINTPASSCELINRWNFQIMLAPTRCYCTVHIRNLLVFLPRNDVVYSYNWLISLLHVGIDVILLDGRRECLQEVVLENTIRAYSENWKKLGLRVDEFDENNARLFLERSELGALVTQRCQAQIREYIEPRSASAYNQKGQQSNSSSSKTKVSRVLQILYRAGCFLVSDHTFSSNNLLPPGFTSTRFTVRRSPLVDQEAGGRRQLIPTCSKQPLALEARFLAWIGRSRSEQPLQSEASFASAARPTHRAPRTRNRLPSVAREVGQSAPQRPERNGTGRSPQGYKSAASFWDAKRRWQGMCIIYSVKHEISFSALKSRGRGFGSNPNEGKKLIFQILFSFKKF